MKINELLENVSKAKTALEKAQSDYEAAIAEVKTNEELRNIFKEAGLEIKKAGSGGIGTGGAGVGRPIVKINTFLKKSAKKTATYDDIASFVGITVDAAKAAIAKKADKYTIKGDSVTLK